MLAAKMPPSAPRALLIPHPRPPKYSTLGSRCLHRPNPTPQPLRRSLEGEITSQQMDSVEDEMAVPPPAEPSPPHHDRRLKRLKKASMVSDVPIPQPRARNSALAFPGSGEQDGVDLLDDCVIPDPGRSAGVASPALKSDGLDEGADLDDGLDPLFGDSYRSEVLGGAAMGDEAEMEASGSFGEGGDGGSGLGEAVDGLGKKKSAKKRLSMDGGDGTSRKKRMTAGEGSRDGKAEESARNKRKLEKERKVYLERLHAESQRLLRETRDASFKAATVVEKPISSVLEKIRQRKLKILKISSASSNTDLLAEANCPVVEPAIAESDKRQDIESIEGAGGISGNEDQILNSDTQETEETSDDYQHCDKENDLPKDCNVELEDISGESPLSTANLNANSDSSDDTSSDEEDYDKENVDPCPDKPVNVNLYRKNDLAKSFVDEEAEEENDSDHDLIRFQENDEEEESEEDEALDDLIATGYEEMPLDNEKRNELHQEWLQQQDAAATDGVLQRLNCGKKQRDLSLIHDEEDDGEPEENYSRESLNDALPVNAIRLHSKNAKQMIAQMFTDAEDAYVSSDDEETEQRLFRQRLLLEQAEERSSFLSAVDDKPSRDVFGLIRKLNTAADPKKKARPSTASLDALFTGGNKSNSFKPSFLGRTTNHSMTFSNNHASSVARSFIFGRDDSSSRSSFSSSENNADMGQQEQPRKNSTAKFCSSQPKSVGPKRKIEAETSGASLFEILRRTSIHFDQQLQLSNHSESKLISATQAAHQFTAFKLNRKSSKKIQEAHRNPT